MVNSKIYSLILLSLLSFARAQDEDPDTTTTITTTPVQEQTTTVGLQEDVIGTEYIFTDSNGVLTTTTVIGTTETNPYTLAPETTTEDPTTSTPATATDATSTASSSGAASSVPKDQFSSLSGSSSSQAGITTTSTTTEDSDETYSPPATSAAGNPYFTEIKIDVPPGVYSTSTMYTNTVLDSGKTAVLELVVLHTAVC
ncbi:hypothetical protein Cantr_09836 [Candida viswanathii]|uniref:Uncharacterized protein n=1 Tax=Candida viswanathii TaxID=5486 RepID=A0A367YCD7_9ASCO|nr:hypothetical protein Cantr_09836 [Candida viswanathii]